MTVLKRFVALTVGKHNAVSDDTKALHSVTNVWSDYFHHMILRHQITAMSDDKKYYHAEQNYV